MKKKSDKELGYIITDGMIDTIGNGDLTDAQVGMFMRSIVRDKREYANGDVIVKALVTAFIEQFKAVNKRRSEMIGRRREGNRERERLRREESQLARERLEKINALCDNMSPHAQTCGNMSAHVRTCGVIKGSKDNNNTPIIPLAGDEKNSSAKSHARKRSPSTKDHALAGSTTTADNGTASTKAGSARTTARKTSNSVGSRERPANISKKTGAPIMQAVERMAGEMAKRHPNAKSSLRAVVRALATTVEEEWFCDEKEPRVIMQEIDAAHAAWCETDGWAEDKGQFVQALAAWISNGGWRKPPPQKKKAPPAKGDEMSFDASL